MITKLQYLKMEFPTDLKLEFLLEAIPLQFLLWEISLNGKKAQKNAKKNIISDTMNKIIPYRRPSCTR